MKHLKIMLATFVYNLELKLAIKTGFIAFISYKFVFYIRKILINVLNDPPCKMKIHNKTLLMPLSFNNPKFIALHSLYDSIFPRLARYVLENDGYLSVIDIGANVGDTVAAFLKDLHSKCEKFDIKLLAIEPYPKFYSYLKHNVNDINECVSIETLNCLCSSENDVIETTFAEYHGTAKITSTNCTHKSKIESLSLDCILHNKSYLASTNLVKIDTDGFDLDILLGSFEVISKRNPSFIFELDMPMNTKNKENLEMILSHFRESGYKDILFYDNFGFLISHFPLNEQENIDNLLLYNLDP